MRSQRMCCRLVGVCIVVDILDIYFEASKKTVETNGLATFFVIVAHAIDVTVRQVGANYSETLCAISPMRSSNSQSLCGK